MFLWDKGPQCNCQVMWQFHVYLLHSWFLYIPFRLMPFPSLRLPAGTGVVSLVRGAPELRRTLHCTTVLSSLKLHCPRGQAWWTCFHVLDSRPCVVCGKWLLSDFCPLSYWIFVLLLTLLSTLLAEYVVFSLFLLMCTYAGPIRAVYF